MSPPPARPSPRISHVPTNSNVPDIRSLPARNIARGSVEDAYVQFIMYANPNISQFADSTELRRTFRCPPRSDSKSFDTYTLWELVRLLEEKELKTWSELAIRLGVELPSAEKGQSSQKVQQYSARLKRWMHAMHIDSFFEYLLGKEHVYYMQRPRPPVRSADVARDGVPAHEDLALRALCPEFRPKRGRRKAGHEEGDEGQPPLKRQQYDLSSTTTPKDAASDLAMFPESALPWSAFPDNSDEQDSWTFATNQLSDLRQTDSLASHTLFRMDQDGPGASRRDLSSSPYPSSAILPRCADIVSYPEPRSATTPSTNNKSGSRRRRGPAVSSAWLANSGMNLGKHRGRPVGDQAPNNGPFPSYPPKMTDEPYEKSPSCGSPNVRMKSTDDIEATRPGCGADVSHISVRNQREKLQLRVPQHAGGPIRLATPPIFLLNGGSDRATHLNGSRLSRRSSADFFRNPEEGLNDDQERLRVVEALNFTLEDVCHAFAANLMHAKLIGRQLIPLTIGEARLIAIEAVKSICAGEPDTASIALLAVRCAFLLGVDHALGLGTSHQQITIRAALQSCPSAAESWKASGQEGRGSYNYTISLDMSVGKSLSSNVQISGIVVPIITPTENIENEFEDLRTYLKGFVGRSASREKPTIEPGNDWQRRCVEMQHVAMAKEAKLSTLKRMMLEVIMTDD